MQNNNLKNKSDILARNELFSPHAWNFYDILCMCVWPTHEHSEKFLDETLRDLTHRLLSSPSKWSWWQPERSIAGGHEFFPSDKALECTRSRALSLFSLVYDCNIYICENLDLYFVKNVQTSLIRQSLARFFFHTTVYIKTGIFFYFFW